MAELKLDTMKFEKDLEAAGLTREQAQASVEAVARVFFNAADDLIDRTDLEIATNKMTMAFSKQREDLKTLIDNQGKTLTRWIVAIGLGEVVGTVAIVLGVVFGAVNFVTAQSARIEATMAYARSAPAPTNTVPTPSNTERSR